MERSKYIPQMWDEELVKRQNGATQECPRRAISPYRRWDEELAKRQNGVAQKYPRQTISPYRRSRDNDYRWRGRRITTKISVRKKVPREKAREEWRSVPHPKESGSAPGARVD